MRARIFVREPGKKYEGGHFGGKPVEFETLPRVGDHLSHPDVPEWLCVDIAVVSAAVESKYVFYVTKVKEPDVVKAAEARK
jgi:hypothetical protein